MSFKLTSITKKKLWSKRSPTDSQTSKLIFVGGTPVRSNFAIDIPPNKVSLDAAQTSDWVEITRMHLDKNTQSHLCNLGLKPGVIAEVVSKTATGSVIICINRQQIGLGAEIVRRLVVNYIHQ